MSKMATTDKSPTSEQQVRLMILNVPRSVSTVLVKCLSFADSSSKVFMENYFNSSVIDPDGPPEVYKNDVLEKAMTAAMEEPPQEEGKTAGSDESHNRQWVKEQLEEAHVGKKIIVCKDMAYALIDQAEFLPKGYRYLFLIRNPLKVFLSYKGLYQSWIKLSPDRFNLTELPLRMLPKDYGFRELLELIEHVKKERDQEAIIIDTDDLLQDPKGILTALFKLIGLSFEEKMLQWEAGSTVAENWTIPERILRWNQVGGFYDKALNSSCFLKPGPLPDRSSLSADILYLADASMPYYEKMYAQRLTAL